MIWNKSVIKQLIILYFFAHQKYNKDSYMFVLSCPVLPPARTGFDRTTKQDRTRFEFWSGPAARQDEVLQDDRTGQGKKSCPVLISVPQSNQDKENKFRCM